MEVIDRIKTTSPPLEDIDNSTNAKEKTTQTRIALSVEFRKSVKSRSAVDKPVEEIINNLTVKDINDIFFDIEVPNAPGKCYYALIEEFLSSPRSYSNSFRPIVDGYLSIVSNLQKRIQHLLISGKTSEADGDFKTSTASYLDARITSICERTKIFIALNDESNQLKNEITSAENKLNKVLYGYEESDKKVPGITETVKELSKDVNNISTKSNQIMPNIISLLGVFSSIIVVILTLITTSSSWLANANNISVLIAFVVPAGIITLAICALTALVRSTLEHQTGITQLNEKKNIWQNITHAFKKWALWLVVVLITSLIVCGTVYFCESKNNKTKHFLIKCSPTTESVSNEDEQSTSQQELFILQETILSTGETKMIRIPCDNDDIHSDGLVYYCLLHECFE